MGISTQSWGRWLGLLAVLGVLFSAGPAIAAAPPGYKVRALGDSVTAGFGYCGTLDHVCGGSQDSEMSVFRLLGCATGPLDDRCSSNFGNPTGHLSNVSWALQFAHSEGVQDFQNTAVQGSTPANWDSGGEFSARLGQIVTDNPNLTLMTLGANPILGEFYKGQGLPCILFGNEAQVRACAQRLLADNHSQTHLESIYSQLLQAPHNHVVVFLYHTPVPAPAAAASLRAKVALVLQQINEMVHRAVLNTESRFPGRITALTPGSSPWPLDHQCTPVQALMVAEWFASFGRSGIRPGKTSTPWVLGSDLCIHPSIAGYQQFVAPLIAWFRGRGSRLAGHATGVEPMLLRVNYRPIQISFGHPRIEVVLSKPAQVTVRTGRDRCLKEEVIHPKACDHRSSTGGAVHTHPDRVFQGHAGAQTEILPEGDGYYYVTVTASASDGSREEQTLELIDQTRAGLLAPFGGRPPR